MLHVQLTKTKPEAGSQIGFLSRTMDLTDSNSNDISDRSIIARRATRLVEPAAEAPQGGSASKVDRNELGGKLCFDQEAVMGRFGGVALKAPRRFTAGEGGGSLPRALDSWEWWATPLQELRHRSFREVDPEPPARMYSDATGLGDTARVT